MRSRSRFIDILLPLANTIITGIFVGLIANKLYGGEHWDKILIRLGWWNLIIPIWLSLIILTIYRSKKIRSEIKNTQLSILKDFENLAEFVVKNLFKLLVETAIYPQKSAGLNIQIFFRGEVDGKKALIKDRRFFYEQERMPRNYPLDYAFPSEDNLVICDSFKKDTLVYEELSLDHMKRYNERIKDKIDLDIKWVLACPLHIPRQEPLGIVCCFGRKKFFKNDQQRRYFEAILLNLCEVIVQLKLFERKILTNEENNSASFTEQKGVS